MKKPINITSYSPIWYPYVSICVAAYNEERFIGKFINSLRSIDYQEDKWEALIVSDGSTDATVEIARSFNDPRIRVFDLPRSGKNTALNTAVNASKYDILVFADADIEFYPQSLAMLIRPLADSSVGGVSGEFRQGGEVNSDKGERTYWKFEHFIKRMQSSAGSITSAVGTLYAIRRNLFVNLLPHITDDFALSIEVVRRGFRLVYEPRALVIHWGVVGENKDFERKKRIVAAGLRSVWFFKDMFNPFRYGWFSLQLLSHKVLRRLNALALAVMALLVPILALTSRFFLLLCFFQFIFHMLAIAGLAMRLFRIKQNKITSLALYFHVVNLASIAALADVLCKRKEKSIWKTVRTS